VFRNSGIKSASDKSLFIVADNENDIAEKVPILSSIKDEVNTRFNIDVLTKDALVLDVEVENYGTFAMITAKSLFYMQYNKASENFDFQKWDWEEIKEIDWERKSGGCIWINNCKLTFLVDYRKPFVDAMKKILRQIKPIADCPIEP
jgi:hypothetical protein